MPVDLVMPVKGLLHGKSRLRGSVGPDIAAHVKLVVSLTLDTITAAAATPGVRRVLVVTSDSVITEALRAERVETLTDGQRPGLNNALLRGFSALHAGSRDPALVVGALQADLPALRPMDLAAAIAEAAGRRTYCADREGTGTTLLLTTPGGILDPTFGPESASAHAASGAHALRAPLPSLRCDVDTAADLAAAGRLGVGARTSALLGTPCR